MVVIVKTHDLYFICNVSFLFITWPAFQINIYITGYGLQITGILVFVCLFVELV